MMKTVKNIPELRFPEFEGKWNNTKVREIGKFIGGGTPDSSHLDYWQGTIPWISSSDIYEKNVHEINISRYITEEAVMESATKAIPKNSVLIVSRVGIGKFAVNKHELCTSQDFTNLIPIVDNSFFLAYLFSARTNKFLCLSQGTSIKGFTGQDIGNLTFQIPSLPEQQKIASFLSAADQRIQLLIKKKEKLEQYKKGIMQQIFSQQLRFKDENGQEYPEWEEKRLGDLTDFIMNGLSLPQNNEGKGVKVTRIETISDRTINIQKVGYVETNQDITRYQLNIGDILFSNINSVAHIGKVVRVDNEYDLFHGMNLLRIKLNRNLCSTRFIYHVLNLESSKKYFEKICNKAVNQASINQTELGKTIIRTPTIPEQQKIASFLSSIDQKINLVNKQIELTRTWKQGLLQKMFV